MLSALTKDDLFKVLDKFDVKIAKSSLKGKIIEKVAEEYNEKPELFLEIFSKGTIEFLANTPERKISEEDFNKYEEFLVPLQSFGVISKSVIKEGKEKYYYISEWFLNTLVDLSKREYEKIERYQELEMLLLGIVRFYGVIDELKVEEIIKKDISDITLDEIHRFLEKRWILNIFISRIEDSGSALKYFVADSVVEPVDLLNEIFKYENLEYKILTKDEYKKYWGYFYVEKTQEIADLITLFMKEKIQGGVIGLELTTIIDKIKNNISIDEIIKDTKSRVNFSTKENEGIFQAIVTKIANTLPLWVLKGNSYIEIFGEKGTPRNVEKIGRNEPCPCGSGKKYKKCCGK